MPEFLKRGRRKIPPSGRGKKFLAIIYERRENMRKGEGRDKDRWIRREKRAKKNIVVIQKKKKKALIGLR